MVVTMVPCGRKLKNTEGEEAAEEERLEHIFFLFLSSSYMVCLSSLRTARKERTREGQMLRHAKETERRRKPTYILSSFSSPAMLNRTAFLTRAATTTRPQTRSATR